MKPDATHWIYLLVVAASVLAKILYEWKDAALIKALTENDLNGGAKISAGEDGIWKLTVCSVLIYLALGVSVITVATKFIVRGMEKENRAIRYVLIIMHTMNFVATLVAVTISFTEHIWLEHHDELRRASVKNFTREDHLVFTGYVWGLFITFVIEAGMGRAILQDPTVRYNDEGLVQYVTDSRVSFTASKPRKPRKGKTT